MLLGKSLVIFVIPFFVGCSSSRAFTLCRTLGTRHDCRTLQLCSNAKPLLVESEELILEWFSDPKAVVIDVRSPMEITSKVKARNWINAPGTPFYNEKLACNASQLIPDKATPVILYCSSGQRSRAAMGVLKKQGYTNVHNAGGIGHLYFLPTENVKSQSNKMLKP